MTEKTFLIDVEKCTGCMLCSIACKDEHVGTAYPPWTKPQPDTGQFWINVESLERGKIPRVRMSYLPILCQNCENAPCIEACPDAAIKTRADGLVWIDPEPCTGCGDCPAACPYGVIYFNDDLGIAQKCTGCAHRVDEGEAPRCVDACPHDAILFGEIETNKQPLEIYHPEYEAGPRVYWQGLPRPWIAGTLIDAIADEVISGASVSVVDLSGDAPLSVLSDAFGDFWITGLETGQKYRVEIKMDGYEDFQAEVTTGDDQDLGTIKLKKTA